MATTRVMQPRADVEPPKKKRKRDTHLFVSRFALEHATVEDIDHAVEALQGLSLILDNAVEELNEGIADGFDSPLLDTSLEGVIALRQKMTMGRLQLAKDVRTLRTWKEKKSEKKGSSGPQDL